MVKLPGADRRVCFRSTLVEAQYWSSAAAHPTGFLVNDCTKTRYPRTPGPACPPFLAVTAWQLGLTMVGLGCGLFLGDEAGMIIVNVDLYER